MYVCVYVYICIYIYICVCVDGWMDVWMYGCMHACMHVWMDGCMDKCMHACMYVYMTNRTEGMFIRVWTILPSSIFNRQRPGAWNQRAPIFGKTLAKRPKDLLRGIETSGWWHGVPWKMWIGWDVGMLQEKKLNVILGFVWKCWREKNKIHRFYQTFRYENGDLGVE